MHLRLVIIIAFKALIPSKSVTVFPLLYSNLGSGGREDVYSPSLKWGVICLSEGPLLRVHTCLAQSVCIYTHTLLGYEPVATSCLFARPVNRAMTVSSADLASSSNLLLPCSLRLGCVIPQAHASNHLTPHYDDPTSGPLVSKSVWVLEVYHNLWSPRSFWGRLFPLNLLCPNVSHIMSVLL